MRGFLKQRAKGSWSLVLYLGKDESGRARQKWHTVRGSRKDAERELARLVTALGSGSYIEPTRMTLGQYLAHWLQSYARPNVSPKTCERYAEIVRCHLVPALGHLVLAKLTPLQLQEYYSWALEAGRRSGRGGLSPQTVLHHHRVLRQALGQAIRWQLVARNVADAVEPPRPAHRPLRALDEGQTAVLVEAMRHGPFALPVLLAVTTGMRRGEILGLRWHDLDLDAGRATVQRTLEETRAGVRPKQPKTAKGRRVVALPLVAVEALRRCRAETRGDDSVGGEASVVTRRLGQPWSPDEFSRAFASAMRRAGLGGVRFHDLRHTHATLLLRQGVHPKIVSERLGHATVSITLDTYSHVLPGMQEEAARKLDAALRPLLGSDRHGNREHEPSL
jgi:integrase